MTLTLILPVHCPNGEEPEVHKCLDSLEADSTALCTCDRFVVLQGKTKDRQLRGRLHKMARMFLETPQKMELGQITSLVPEGDIIVMSQDCIVERGWLDRLVIDADKAAGITCKPGYYYLPRRVLDGTSPQPIDNAG
jgi:hypothetical protein